MPGLKTIEIRCYLFESLIGMLTHSEVWTSDSRTRSARNGGNRMSGEVLLKVLRGGYAAISLIRQLAIKPSP